MSPLRPVMSFLEVVSIDDVRRFLDEILASSFSDAERAHLRDKPVQSVAGRLALKRAMCKSAAACFGQDLAPRDVAVSTKDNGAPRVTIEGFPLPAFGRDLFVSISHSRTSAAALVAVSTRSAA